MAQKQIVIAQRGWVFVGDVTTTAEEVVIDNCKNIRRWGTTNLAGLGHLAKNGSTPSTILDDYGTVRLHPLSIVARIDVSTDKL